MTTETPMPLTGDQLARAAALTIAKEASDGFPFGTTPARLIELADYILQGSPGKPDPDPVEPQFVEPEFGCCTDPECGICHPEPEHDTKATRKAARKAARKVKEYLS